MRELLTCAGISNFNLKELIELLEWAEVPPAVVQRHADVFSQDTAVQRFCLTQGIRYTAYSALGTQYLQSGFSSSPVLAVEAVRAIAAAHSITPAQACPQSPAPIVVSVTRKASVDNALRRMPGEKHILWLRVMNV